ncbi:hypothetical protein ENSA5_11290 [Enhygromyxa salina]|uniref:Endo-1,4-beta-xylanase A n=1 Tax=Enhygromyxa salina TaxID=215803 RepID=A0A2S9YGB5_9BACT|nr:hypothetical protein [Enhygromyxa salina]PRQ04081.1 hypothetical protein ENSA5_11290 [Enhygromyxa salina]
MHRRATVLALCLVGCSTGEETLSTDTFSTLDNEDAETSGDGDSGDGDGDTVGDGDGDGDGDSGDGDSGDGDSGDGDGDSGDGDGDSGDGDGDGDSGDGDVCDRNLYVHHLDNNSWDTQPLDAVWTGPNAPPCSVEPMATNYLEIWDQLLVWGADGFFYRRVGGAWQPPEPIADRWAVIADLPLDSVHYTPPLNGSSSAVLVFTSLPTAYVYEVFEDGSSTYDQSIEMMDEPLPGPPQSSSRRNWAVVLANAELLGQAEWWTSWQGFDNGKVYRADGAFIWDSWAENQAPVFVGAPGSLDPSTIEAGWGDYDLNRAYLVGP